MPKHDPVEQALAPLRGIAASGDSPATRELLKTSLASKYNLVAAKAAAVIEELGLKDLAENIEAAFHRFLREPTKSDKGCFAKTAIAKSLYTLGTGTESVFLSGIRHIQLESTYGGSIDVAAELRGYCALGLVQIGYRDAMTELADLLMDREMQARIMAARAIAYSERPEGALMLRLKIRAGDRDVDVMGECFIAILRLARAKAVPLVAEFLDHAQDDLKQSAALALGESRLPEAFAALKTHWEGKFNPDVRRILLLGIVTVRSADSLQFALAVLSDGQRQPALDALEALRIYRHDQGVWEQVGNIVNDKNGAELTRYFSGI
jgi:hypothetical protein